jgi:hypothetical protein
MGQQIVISSRIAVYWYFVTRHLRSFCVSVTISRITGEPTIQRRQDNNSQHDTRDDGSCTVFKPLF